MKSKVNQTATKHVITSNMDETILLTRKDLINILQAVDLNTKQVCELQKFVRKNFIKQD